MSEQGHFGAAARGLGVTQPPLSQGIARLERELGVQLLHRSAAGVSTTRAGATLLPLAVSLLAADGALRDTARRCREHRTGTRVGVPGELTDAGVALVAAACAAREEALEIDTAASVDVVTGVSSGRLEAGIVVHPCVLADLEAGPVVLVTHQLLVPHDSPPGASLRALLQLPVAAPSRGDCPPAHDLLVDSLLSLGSTAGTVTARDHRAALALVAAGRACALVSGETAPHPAGRLVDLPDGVLPLRLRVVWRRDSPVSAEVGAVLVAALRLVPGLPGRTQR